MASAVMAFLHHLFAFTLVACVVYEFIAFRKGFTIEEARRIQRVDLFYGISAGLLLIVGLLRVFFFEKGAAFYSQSLFFWVKMGTFLIVGLLSIDPTIRYIRWNKVISENKAPEVSDKEFKRTRFILWLEVMDSSSSCCRRRSWQEALGLISHGFHRFTRIKPAC